MATGPKPSTNPKALDRILDSTFDSTVSHFLRVLQTQSGIDSTLFAFGYSTNALAILLDKVVDSNVKQLAEKLAENAAKQISPGETIVATQVIPQGSAIARLSNATASMKAFAGMCSDVRTFMRLWGLLKLWVAFKAAYKNPSADPVIRYTTWGKLASLFGYYTLEPYWYLSMKGVIRDVPKEKSAKSFRLACWAYIVYMALDFIRLGRVAQKQQERRALSDGEKEDKIKQKAEDDAWWLSFIVNGVYFPLTFHWASPEGFIHPGIVSAYGSLAGWAGLRAAWKATA